jgi:hypothetical protein
MRRRLTVALSRRYCDAPAAPLRYSGNAMVYDVEPTLNRIFCHQSGLK